MASKIISIIVLISLILITGCSKNPVENKMMSSSKLQDKTDMELLDMEDEDTQEDENKELYFAQTKNKILYSGRYSDKSNISTQIEILLNNLFQDNKKNLPKISRKKKLNISLEISNNSINKNGVLEAAQEYILSNKRYALSNTDTQSLQVLKKVLRSERDSIYKNRHSTQLKNSSNIILFISLTRLEKDLKLKAKIISKNGQILGQNQTIINAAKQSNQQWVSVKVPRVDAPSQLFYVMSSPVTIKQYSGTNSDLSVTDVSYINANNFCKKTMKGELLHPYVFEHARRSLAIKRPSSNANIEIISAYDDEDHEMYFQEDDNLEAEESTIVTFQWNSEKYFATSDLIKAPNMTFRCMRTK